MIASVNTDLFKMAVKFSKSGLGLKKHHIFPDYYTVVSYISLLASVQAPNID